MEGKRGRCIDSDVGLCFGERLVGIAIAERRGSWIYFLAYGNTHFLLFHSCTYGNTVIFPFFFFFILSSVPTVSCPSSILSSMATLSFFRSFANGNTVIFPILFSQLMAMLLFSPVFHSLTSGKMIILLCQSLPDTLPS